MLKDFYNWATNNDTYMVFLHCLRGDKDTLFWLLFWTFVVVLGYFLIGFDYLKTYLIIQKQNNLKFWEISKSPLVGKDTLLICLVFFGCALAGYLFDFLRVWFPAYKLLVHIRFFLALFTVGAVYYKIKIPSELVELNKNREKLKIKAEILEVELKVKEYEEGLNNLKNKYKNG